MPYAVGNGNPTTFAGTGLSWNHENRLTRHGTALDAAYRGDGLRAWKEGSARTYFLYDGINVVCELDADGDLLASSTFGAAGLLSRGSVQYQFDPLGDAVHLLDGDGDVLAHRLFDAWGNELTSGTFDPRGYRARYGYYTDQETGLIALAYRYYAPGPGRFLNRDPIGYRGGVNVYGYVANVATSRGDPTGRVYGRYCGPRAVGPGAPYDPLDACCKAHDECLWAAACGAWGWLNPRRSDCQQCNLKLCVCAASVACTGYRCILAQRSIWNSFQCERRTRELGRHTGADLGCWVTQAGAALGAKTGDSLTQLIPWEAL